MAAPRRSPRDLNPLTPVDAWMIATDKFRLTKAREAMGYSQSDLARLCQTSQTTISKMERLAPLAKEPSFSAELCAEVAKRLHLPLEAVFAYTSAPSVGRPSTSRARTSRPRPPAAEEADRARA